MAQKVRDGLLSPLAVMRSALSTLVNKPFGAYHLESLLSKLSVALLPMVRCVACVGLLFLPTLSVHLTSPMQATRANAQSLTLKP